MSIQPIGASFVNDNRAVSEVIGVVILFGFLILALSLYQVEVVPQQNAEVEFQHFEDVRNDLIELRASILQAGSIDQPQYQTVQLGTTYSTRVFSINPPAPAGTIRTTQSYPITISNGSDTPNGTITIPTRFIQYRPGYNELDQPSTWYDASVLYVDARGEGGGIAVIEDQALVESGEVQLTAVQREFQRSGTGRVTLELRPAKNVTGEIPTGDNLTVTIPTRLNETDWETKTDLPTNSSVYVGVTDTDTDGVGGFNIYNLTLNTTPDRLTVDTVGVQQDPDEPTQNDAASIPDGSGSDGGTDGGDGGTDGGDGGTGGSGTAGFSNVDASDLPKGGGEDGGSSQTLSFTVNDTLPSGESVTIDLSSAQQGDFDYRSSSVNSIGGSNKGSAQFTAQDNSSAVITYTVTQDISPGEQIQLEVSSVLYDNGNRGEYTVVFTRSDGASASDIFSDKK